MLAAARHSAIIAEVQRERIVPAADLPQMLGVSLMTVRRDIEALDAGGAADVPPERVPVHRDLPGGERTPLDAPVGPRASPRCRAVGAGSRRRLSFTS